MTPPRDRTSQRTETLDYIQGMLGQLRIMAQANRHDMLSYLIEIAYIEVSDMIRGERPLRLGAPSNEAEAPSVDDDKRNSAA